MRQGREYWSRHVTAWRRSGLTKKAYCEQHVELSRFGGRVTSDVHNPVAEEQSSRWRWPSSRSSCCRLHFVGIEGNG